MIEPLMLAMQAGALSGLGPCGLSRGLTLRTIAREGSAKQRCQMVGFAGGLVAGYVTFGSLLVAVGAAVSSSAITYYVAAAVCATAGIAEVWKARDTEQRVCRKGEGSSTASGAFSVGAVCSSLGSPCCGPLSAALAGVSVTSLSRVDAIEVLTAYAVGHALPVALICFGGNAMAARLTSVPGRFFDMVVGGLFLGLGGYYAVLA